MTQVKGICEQLWSQGIHHFVVLSSSGAALQSSGDFSDPQKQVLAASILLHLSALVQPNETCQRLTMTFPNAVYVATTFSGENEYDTFGVVVKHPVAVPTVSSPAASSGEWARTGYILFVLKHTQTHTNKEFCLRIHIYVLKLIYSNIYSNVRTGILWTILLLFYSVVYLEWFILLRSCLPFCLPYRIFSVLSFFWYTLSFIFSSESHKKQIQRIIDNYCIFIFKISTEGK